MLVSRGVFSSCIVTVPSSVGLGLLKRTIGGGGLAGRPFLRMPFLLGRSFSGKESSTCVGSDCSTISIFSCSEWIVITWGVIASNILLTVCMFRGGTRGGSSSCERGSMSVESVSSVSIDAFFASSDASHALQKSWQSDSAPSVFVRWT